MSHWKTRDVWRLVAVALAASLAAGAAAQVQNEFVPATDIARESLPAGPLLYTAYALVWVAVVAYLFVLWRRLDRVERDLRDVHARLSGDRRSRPS